MSFVVPINRRVDQLETRVERIERELRLQSLEQERIDVPRDEPPVVVQLPERKPEPVHIAKPEPPPIPRTVSSAPTAPILPRHSAPLVEHDQTRDLPTREAPVAAVPAGDRPTKVIPYAPINVESPVEQGTFEQTIGLKWAGWIGAIVLVIGAGLGIKYAYEHGYFEILPPAARLFLMSLGGLGLIGAGEWVYRRVNKLAAAGLYASGVATLFFVSHAGHAYYGLYQPTTAFVMMALTTLIGSAVAMRGRLMSIAVLSLIGGNLAPFVLGIDNLHPVPFLTYLLMLQLISVFLAWWGRDARWLRGLSLASTSLWLLPMFLPYPPSTTVLVFALIYAAVYQLELLASAARGGGGAGDPSTRVRDDVGFSIAVTAALTFAVFVLTRHLTDAAQGAWIAALSAACGFAGTVLSIARRDGTRRLAIGFIVQAATLAALAVPVAFDGVTVSMGWAALALGFAGAGAALGQRSLRNAAVVTWMLAAGQFAGWAILWGSREAAETTPLMSAWLLAAVGHGIAWLSILRANAAKTEEAERVTLGQFIAGAAGVVFAVAAIAWLSPLAATVAIVAYAWVAAVVDRFDDRLGLLWHAGAMVLVAAVKWAVVDTLADRLAPGWSAAAYRPLLNPHMAAGTLISMSIAGLYWIRRDAWQRVIGRGGGMLAVAGMLIVLMGFTLSIEVDRVVERALAAGAIAWPPAQLKQLAWTMLWTATAMVYAGVARVVEPDPARRAGPINFVAGVVFLLVGKYLLIDTFGFRIGRSPADVVPLANMQVLAAAFVLGAVVAVRALLSRLPNPMPGARELAAFVTVLLVLWTGSLEIDRAYDGMAKQLGLSIFWSVFAVISVAGGFRFRVAGLRYAGLALFAAALLKVVVVDLRGVADGYRVLSFMALGALLLGTSVLYGKLSPKLLEE